MSQVTGQFVADPSGETRGSVHSGTNGSGSPRRPRILHVEVGGMLGGSGVCADLHLRFCDDRFDHELLFYSLPRERQLESGKRFVIRDLAWQVTAASGGASVGKASVRNFIKRIPVVAKLAAAGVRMSGYPREIHRAWKLAQLFRRGEYDLIHCNNNFNYQPSTSLGAWLAGKPLVAHYRTPVPVSGFDRWLARRADVIIAINENVAQDLAGKGIRDHVVVCHDPCERPQASRCERLRQQLLPRGGTLLVGSISRLEANKGMDLLLHAAKSLRSSWPEVRYVIVGTGSQLGGLQQLAAQLGVEDLVQFTGFVPDAYAHLACMDVFVCPSHFEGGPLTVLEAMALGVPVVTTNVGAVDQWIRSHQDGVIVPVGNAAGLAQGLDLLLGNAELRQRIGKSAALRARQFGDPAEAAKQLEAVFARVLEQRASRHR